LIKTLRQKWYLKTRQRWQTTEVLIIDEVSMIEPGLFSKLDKIAKAIRRNNNAFGGIQVVAFGDFFQLMPIESSHAGPQTPIFCFETSEWRDCFKTTIQLKHVHRQADPIFIDLLESIRRGNLSKEDKEILERRKTSSSVSECPKLFPLKRNVDELNKLELAKIDEQQFHFSAQLKMINHFGGDPVGEKDLLEKFAQQCPADTTLPLKIGARVMLVINLSPSDGLINGACGVIEKFESRQVSFFDQATFVPVVKFDNGISRKITPHEWTKAVDKQGFKNSIMSFKQIPLILAWAITIHKVRIIFSSSFPFSNFFFKKKVSRHDFEEG